MRYCLLLILILGWCSCKNNKQIVQVEKNDTSVYAKAEFSSSDDYVLPYRIYYPKNFNSELKYPIFVFLHGASERGNDNEAQLTHGSELIGKKMDELGGIAIFPQCPENENWVNVTIDQTTDDVSVDHIIDADKPATPSLNAVIKLLKELKSESYIDKNRLYVSGLSMGGMGTFDLLYRMPGEIAAAAPICGAGAPEKAFDMIRTPIRLYHGEKDYIVPSKESKVMEREFRKYKGNVETFYYENVGHDSWNNAFSEPDFVEWFFQHSLDK